MKHEIASKIKDFARDNKLPIFDSQSPFPRYYATHSFTDMSLLNSEFILSSRESGIATFTSEIDQILDLDRYVFFALGKGYLKSKDCVGLVYDPFVIVQQTGANLVSNDILYLLDQSGFVHKFIHSHISEFERVLSSSRTTRTVFFDNLRMNKSFLIYEAEDINHRNACVAFENALRSLDKSAKDEFRNMATVNIIEPNTVATNLDNDIAEYFKKESALLNSFFDQVKEERIIELRMPDRYPVACGLIGIYCEN